MGGLLQRMRATAAVQDMPPAASRSSGDIGSDKGRRPQPTPAGHAGADLTALLAEVQEEVLTRRPELIQPASGDGLQRQRLHTFVLAYLARKGIGDPRGREDLARTLTAELSGYGPLEPFLADPDVTEIMINGPERIYIEKGGRLQMTGSTFRDHEHLMQLVQRIIAPLGRRLDASRPYVDARLADGSRLHAIIQPIALDGPVVTIRRFAVERLTADDLVALESLTEEMVRYLASEVGRGANILVSGGTSSGKTTMLNVLSAFIPDHERIVTIEEAAELSLAQSHVVRLEARPANAEGYGEITVRDLVRNALRMRPDRIIIGEVRGAEAFDLLQAMNTGHRGSLCTIHANSCTDALTRFENMVLMAPEHLPHPVVRQQIQATVDLVIHQERLPDGRRKVMEVAVMAGSGPQRRLQTRYFYSVEQGFVAVAEAGGPGVGEAP